MAAIAVVGAGLMGHGIAQVFAAAGRPVAVYDSVADVAANVRTRVAANLMGLGEDAGCIELIEIAESLEGALHGCDVVFEAVREDLETKRELIARISSLTPESPIIASNTSAFAIGELAAHARDPGRVVGAHWWNPPFLIPLVEVTQAEATRPETVAELMALLESVGKAPVHLRRDIPGFVGNRLQHALWREALALVDAGVCDPDEIDHIVKNSFGLRLAVLGPLENADLVGLDLTRSIHEYLLPHLSRATAPARTLTELIDRGQLGVKTGAGLQDWPQERTDELRARLSEHLRRAHVERRQRASPA